MIDDEELGWIRFYVWRAQKLIQNVKKAYDNSEMVYYLKGVDYNLKLVKQIIEWETKVECKTCQISMRYSSIQQAYNESTNHQTQNNTHRVFVSVKRKE